MVNIGVIGYGYWGPNLVRNFSAVDNASVRMIADMRKDRLNAVTKLYPTVTTTENPDDVINSKDIDAVVIALPVSAHYEAAKKALEAGKHVLVEKPLTDSSEKAQELIRIAKEKKLILMVDHTFLYTGAVKKMKSLMESGEIGEIQYFDSVRINLGLFQHDVNAIWDLAPHDISIMAQLIDKEPHSVVATGISHTGNGIENLAYLTINFTGNVLAHFNVSWTSPVKIRKILVGGTKKMIVFDDLEPTEKIRVYDTGYKLISQEEENRIRVDYRTGDVYIPKLDGQEALKGVAMDFIDSINTGNEPLSSAKLGLSVVKILEAAQESIKNRGREVLVK